MGHNFKSRKWEMGLVSQEKKRSQGGRGGNDWQLEGGPVSTPGPHTPGALPGQLSTRLSS